MINKKGRLRPKDEAVVKNKRLFLRRNLAKACRMVRAELKALKVATTLEEEQRLWTALSVLPTL